MHSIRASLERNEFSTSAWARGRVALIRLNVELLKRLDGEDARLVDLGVITQDVSHHKTDVALLLQVAARTHEADRAVEEVAVRLRVEPRGGTIVRSSVAHGAAVGVSHATGSRTGGDSASLAGFGDAQRSSWAELSGVE